MKLHYLKAALSALLLLTASFGQATPTITTGGWAAWWQWLLPEVQQPESQVVCPGFPHCPEPPVAPAGQKQK